MLCIHVHRNGNVYLFQSSALAYGINMRTRNMVNVELYK